MRIHVVIVSDQVLANLIPSLMERPDLVVLVCSAGMAERGLDRRLSDALARESIPTHPRMGAPDVGLVDIRNYAAALAEDLTEARPDAEIVLNATGGTKLMSLAFVEAFRNLARRTLYTDTAHRRVEYLPTASDPAPSHIPMRDVLRVPDYLAAQGFQCLSIASDDLDRLKRVQRREDVCAYLAKHATKLGSLLGVINAMVGTALHRVDGRWEESLADPVQVFKNTPQGPWVGALSHLVSAGLIEWHRGEREVRFFDTEAAKFLRGGWLEEYAWHCATTAGLYDVCLGVVGHWESAPSTRNELDLLACHLNQLLVIECKTASFDHSNDSDLAYKLDSLSSDLRGLFGVAWLLTARSPSPGLVDRARLNRFRLVGPNELPFLAAALADWAQGNANHG
jgi:hypothetical protein